MKEEEFVDHPVRSFVPMLASKDHLTTNVQHKSSSLLQKKNNKEECDELKSVSVC